MTAVDVLGSGPELADGTGGSVDTVIGAAIRSISQIPGQYMLGKVSEATAMRNRVGPAVIISVLLGTLVIGAVSARAEEILTNETIVAMKKAGLTDGIVLAKLRSSQAKFNLSTQALVDLKAAGVSDQVIEAMMAHPGPAPGATSAPSMPGMIGVPVAPGVPTMPMVPGFQRGREVMYHVNGDKYVEMMPVAVEVQTNSQFFTYKSEVVLAGRRARYRIIERQPAFLGPYASTEALLVRLKPGDDHDDRNLKVGSGSAMPFGFSGRHGVRAEDRIDVVSEQDPRGLFRISPSAPLPPGEYGFVLLGGNVTATTGKIFEFGID